MNSYACLREREAVRMYNKVVYIGKLIPIDQLDKSCNITSCERTIFYIIHEFDISMYGIVEIIRFRLI